jgi:AcrR family transcriptional regulator
MTDFPGLEKRETRGTRRIRPTLVMSNQPLIDSLVSASIAANRRQPAQDRSLRTVARILDAASSLLTQMPLEEVTTRRIASEPGLSVGAVYRFFPDMQSIIDAIAVRHVLQFRGLVDKEVMRPLLQQLQNLENFDPTAVLDRMIDAYVPLSRCPSRLPHHLLSGATSAPPSRQERRPAPVFPPCSLPSWSSACAFLTPPSSNSC